MSRLVQNVKSNLSVFALKVVMTLVLTPIMLRHLGNYDYGIWELLGSVVGYMSLLDLGLSPTISRYVAKFTAEGDTKRINQVWNSTLLLMSVAGLITGGALVIWGLFFAESIAPPGETTIFRYSAVLVIVGIQLTMTFPGIVLISFIEGVQQYKAKNNVIILNSIIGSIVILTAIDSHNALILIALTNMVGNAIKYAYYYWFLSRDKDLAIKLTPSDISIPTTKELLVFGGKSFVQGAGHRLSRYADNFIISSFSGTATIVFFALPNALLRHVLDLILNITSAFLPFFSEHAAKNNKSLILDVYLFASKVTLSITFLFLIGIYFLGSDFLGLWVGEDYARKGHYVLMILTTYIFVHTINPFDNKLVTALGKHGYFAKTTSIEAGGNIVISLLLAPRFGIEGVALGTLLPSIVLKFYTLKYCCKLLEISIAKYCMACIAPNIFPIILMGSALLFAKQYHEVSNFFWLIAYGGVSGAIWIFATLFFTLSRDERKRISDYLLAK